MTFLSLPLLAACALALSLAAPVKVRPWLERLGVVDVASARSSHVGTVVRGMGLSCLLVFCAVGLCAVLLDPVLRSSWLAWTLLIGAVLCGALGWAEDLRGVSPRDRLLLQLVIGFFSALALVLAYDLSPWLILLGVVAVPVSVNAVNFMDGLNGITSLFALVAGGYYALLGVVNGLPWMTAMGLVCASIFVGFLPWNFGWFGISGAFMGDSGSYFCGGLLGLLALCGFLSGIPVEAVVAPFLIYLADTGYTLFRRMVQGKKLSEPHREHVYQRLTQLGLSHVASAGTVVVFTAACCWCGANGAAGDANRLNVMAFATVGLIALYLALPWSAARLRSSRP